MGTEACGISLNLYFLLSMHVYLLEECGQAAQYTCNFINILRIGNLFQGDQWRILETPAVIISKWFSIPEQHQGLHFASSDNNSGFNSRDNSSVFLSSKGTAFVCSDSDNSMFTSRDNDSVFTSSDDNSAVSSRDGNSAFLCSNEDWICQQWQWRLSVCQQQ